MSLRKFVQTTIQTWTLDSKSTFQSLCLLPSRSCQATLRLLSLAIRKVNKKENRLIIRWHEFWRSVVLNSCCVVLINVNWKKVYFLGPFKPAPKSMRSSETTNQARNVAIKGQTCRVFGFYWSCTQVFDLFIKKEQKREKNSSPFRFRFDKQVGEFTAKEFPELFPWFAKVCQVFHMYFAFIPSANFHALENGRMLLD